jgi:NADPH:quinone reductase-like Zn-dependent oxidoreductase
MASLSRLRRALTPTGTLVLVGGEGGGSVSGGTIGRQLRARALSLVSGQRLTSVLCKENAADLEVLAGLITSGAVVPSVGGSFPLDRGAEAMRALADGRVRGKVAITM